MTQKTRRKLQSARDKAQGHRRVEPTSLDKHRQFFDALRQFQTPSEMDHRIPPGMIEFASTFMALLITGASATESPELSLQRLQFLRKLVKKTQLSCTSLVLGLLYLVRLRRRYKTVTLPFDPLHPGCAELAVAFLVADKYLSDTPPANVYWAECCGYSLMDFNNMEGHFLQRLQFDLHFDPKEYGDFLSFLELNLGLQKMQAFPSLSYDDVCRLLEESPPSFKDFLNLPLRPFEALYLILKVASLIVIAYVVSIVAFVAAQSVLHDLLQSIVPFMQPPGVTTI